MAALKIEVENLRGLYVGSIELGGMTARRETIRASSFDEMIEQLIDAHARLNGALFDTAPREHDPATLPPAPDAAPRRRARSTRKEAA